MVLKHLVKGRNAKLTRNIVSKFADCIMTGTPSYLIIYDKRTVEKIALLHTMHQQCQPFFPGGNSAFAGPVDNIVLSICDITETAIFDLYCYPTDNSVNSLPLLLIP